MEIASRPFGSDAIEPGSECIQLLYNKPSNTIVAQFRRMASSGLPIEELYLRVASELEYRKVVGSDAQITCWDPLSCGHKPFVIFNAFKLGGAGGDWVSVSRIDLPRGNVKRLIDRSTLRLPDHFTAGWIASILDIDSEGRTILCRLALETERDGVGSVQYFVSEIDVTTGGISNLATLPNVFV